ncbi:MAG TPA: glycosyltransferase [Pyrinomonadaceae bacterium]|jgi:glycosyltransferase involved in cell wall biosynthesis|nr:glycosyltransferase [Pyrinomonadaceae bacterium]
MSSLAGAGPGAAPVIILIPVYNDWESSGLLVPLVDSVLAADGLRAEVLFVDDASTKPDDGARRWPERRFEAVTLVEVLELGRNLGHQRAIAVGLAHVHAKKRCGAIVIMDADGEDDPKDIPRLLRVFHEQGESKVVFAQRTKRSEAWTFRLFYYLYRGMYRGLTGTKVRFGNFSVIPCGLLPKLVVVSELWNHYAAGIMKARIPYVEISTTRGRRLAGRSRMNFVSLVIHGLGAISVHADVIGVRALVATLLLSLVTIVGISVVVLIRVFTDLAIPGWASSLTVLFLILLTQAVMMASLFVFIILNNRSNLGFIPRRDYEQFVLTVRPLYSRV